jgi:O-acetyl-ADP-ribose deacetylase (regulator of RNase III)
MKYVIGNLLDDNLKFDVIAHGANCFCTMGSGIAPQIKAKYPEAYEVDCATKKGDKNKLGTLTHTVKQTNPIVVNCYTQYDYRGRLGGRMDLDYKALQSCMKLLKEKFTGKTIGLPMIGSGLAGGDWSIISKIIESELDGEDVTIVQLPK